MGSTVEIQKIKMTALGHFISDQVHAYEAGRQPDAAHSLGCIQLNSGFNFEQALIGLEGCARIWVLFVFHHNGHWKPMVLPPRGLSHKIGVFATRSPYRPNPIGMSCLKIERIDTANLRIYVEGADILDGSPILDIKPYIAYADSFPECEPDWLKTAEKFQVYFSASTEEQLNWLEAKGVSQLRGFLLHQLEYEPTNFKKKRLINKSSQNFVIAYRTWRAEFQLIDKNVSVIQIFSGYSEMDLAKNEDLHLDKELHCLFKKRFFSETI